MSIPAVFTNFLPAQVTEHLEKGCQTISKVATQAQGLYKQTEERLITLLKDTLPEEVHTVAEKVARSIPETLFAASMLSGSMKLAASIYGVARLTWAATPMIQSALNGDFEGEPMERAAGQALERLKQINERFRPAIFLACAVGAVASTALGIASFSPTLTMTGAFLGMISYMAFESIQEVKQVAQPAPQPQHQAAAVQVAQQNAPVGVD